MLECIKRTNKVIEESKVTWTFIAGKGKERGWIKEYLEGDNLPSDRRKGHWREQKIMDKQGYKNGKSEAQVQGLWGIAGEEQSDNSLVYCPSFQQSAVHEVLSQRRYIFIYCSIQWL